ncbi:MAG: hypothetical protein HYY59_03615 [Candidatus Omnitrophica bacterium]|nr:hypothetical protein [Candidatus Omnitrophota bacterium]MBI3021071.1 hypothetical protein [Candidatus Omnitrophota bacterium]
MGDTIQGVLGLTPKDQLVLQRSRKHLKGLFVSGWVLTVLSLFIPVVIAANYHYLFSEFENISRSATEKLQAESNRLKSLQTTTPLERELVGELVERNLQLGTLLRRHVTASIMIVVAVLVGGLLHQGVSLLTQAYVQRRYLRIIDALERTLHLSRG